MLKRLFAHTSLADHYSIVTSISATRGGWWGLAPQLVIAPPPK